MVLPESKDEYNEISPLQDPFDFDTLSRKQEQQMNYRKVMCCISSLIICVLIVALSYSYRSEIGHIGVKQFSIEFTGTRIGNNDADAPVVIESGTKNIVQNEQLAKLDITIIIPTMSRHDKVLELVASIRKFYPFHIHIADDGKESMGNLYAGCLSCSYDWVGYDKGLSYKRNFLVEKSTSKYVIVIDDDMLWTKSVDIHKAVSILETGADIVGFKLDDRALYPVKTSVVNGTLVRCKLPAVSNDNCFETDYVLNIFIANRNILLKHKWDEDLKLAEHAAFFLMLKKNGIHIKFCKDMMIKHNNKKRSVYQDSNYDKLRDRARGYLSSIVNAKYGFSMVSNDLKSC